MRKMSHYYYFLSVSSFPSSCGFAGKVLSDFLILTQALSTAEQVVRKTSLSSSNISVSFVLVSLCNMTACGAANSELRPF